MPKMLSASVIQEGDEFIRKELYSSSTYGSRRREDGVGNEVSAAASDYSSE